MPLEFTLAIDDNPLIYKGENIVLAVNTWMWYNVVMESRDKTIMNLLVDYEDQADWLQDSIVIKNIETPVNPGELRHRVFEETRSMFNPPSEHIRIVGYSPADSDVVVKHGVNFWIDADNIFAN